MSRLTKWEREQQTNQPDQAANRSSRTPVFAIVGVGCALLVIFLTLFELVWTRLNNVENNISKLNGQLEPIFRKHYKEIAAANGIIATAIEAIPLNQSASRRVTITAEGKSPEGAVYNLSYTFIRIRAEMLWFDEVIRVNDKVVGPTQVALPLKISAAAPVAGIKLLNITLPNLFIVVIDRPTRNLAVVALGTKGQESKPVPR